MLLTIFVCIWKNIVDYSFLATYNFKMDSKSALHISLRVCNLFHAFDVNTLNCCIKERCCWNRMCFVQIC